MPTIFISYRRDDAEGEAGRLFDDLTAQFGADSIFMDVANIEAGRDFRKVIDQNVRSCDVLLAMIGKGWVNASDDAGRRRLDDPRDFVRLETASALKRDIPVIPVLVHGASMPHAEQLPEELKELAYRNGVELTHARWDSDVQVLIKALGQDLGGLPKGASGVKTGPSAARAPDRPAVGRTAPAATAQPVRKSRSAIVAAVVAAILVAVGSLAAYILLSSRNGRKPPAVEQAPSAEQAAEYPRSLPAPLSSQEQKPPSVSVQSQRSAGGSGVTIHWSGQRAAGWELFDASKKNVSGLQVCEPGEAGGCAQDVAPASYFLQIDVPGFQLIPITISPGRTTEVTPRAGTITIHWQGQRAAGWELFDASKKNVSGLQVCGPGEDGVCTQDVAPGSYFLHIDVPGYQPIPVTISASRITEITP